MKLYLSIDVISTTKISKFNKYHFIVYLSIILDFYIALYIILANLCVANFQSKRWQFAELCH